MALGRPGLKPCVPLGVRLRVVIDQQTEAEPEIQGTGPSLRLALATTSGSQNI